MVPVRPSPAPMIRSANFNLLPEYGFYTSPFSRRAKLWKCAPVAGGRSVAHPLGLRRRFVDRSHFPVRLRHSTELNEVRVLCNSLLLNDGKLPIDKLPGWPNSAGGSMKLSPEKSVPKLEVGDDVKLSEADFVRLCNAFFAEIEKRYL